MAVKKRTADLDWEDLRHFLALAEAQSLSGAARALKVNHATVARRVGELESALGRQLFRRGPSGYTLSEDGTAVFREASAMRRAALAVVESSEPSGLSGLVRVSATRGIAEAFLVGALSRVSAEHPAIELELKADLRVVSLARREADLAVRFGRLADSELVGRRLGALRFDFYAARGRSQIERVPRLIGYDAESDFVPEARWLEEHFPSAHFTLRTNSQAVQFEAAREGLGVALLPRYLAARDSRLVRVDLGRVPPERPLWLVLRRESRSVDRIRAVAEAIERWFEEFWPV